MPYLIAYRKHIDAMHTRELRLPDQGGMRRAGHELALLADGRTIVMIDDGHELPADQPAEVQPTIERLPSPLPVELRDAIRAASPQVRLIDQQVVERIRARYSIEDEIKFLRLAPSDDTAAWNAYVEDCRAWGRAEKAQLGL